jgi:hypothetical protein
MTTRTSTTTLLLALLMAAPTALAGWGAVGSHEPDTLADQTDGWMFPDHDVSPCTTAGCDTNDVYLNGFFTTCGDVPVPGVGAVAECGAVTPNLATLGTSIHQPEYQLAALLGVWKDCNADGYVGLGDQGLFEYRSEVLAAWPGVGDSICPVTPTPIDPHFGKPPVNWTASHNDGTWVHEFLSLQPKNELIGDVNPYSNLNDDGAKVWAAVGLPGTFHQVCYYASYPQGTFHSTGGLLQTFDCWDGYQATATFDAVADGTATTQPYSFSDHPHDQSASASKANVANPWGVPSDRPIVDAWDCSAPVVDEHHDLGKPPVGTGNDVWVNATAYAPKAPPPTDASGSLAGTMNSTYAPCARDARTGDSAESTLPYTLETGTTLPAVKQYTDVLGAVDNARPAAPLGAVPGYGKSGPGSAGVEAVPPGAGGTDGVYLGNRIYGSETLFTDPNGGGVSGVPSFTYYAYVDPLAISMYHLSLPRSPYGAQLVTGAYGAEACGSFTTGIHGQWDCDATHWTSSVKVGAAYDLRDVDCYDQSASAARGAGVGWGVLTGTQCDNV